ncbi:hypothetical protein PCANC_28441 [Puccinia coronata f. sp. avenae]|uniref:Uncharacterized protein n=1 Tax=Puccinia coronata f. sp. avenae TaxID=200324 RepID=A0A2N5TF61_9BASI|nr:hypothetical protein PCANC_28441 [Puccinia coronata f. sp. avenae]PLW24951.1 hypothetical protein PCASD_24232 [Puccinia coronata f. sp. avenae]
MILNYHCDLFCFPSSPLPSVALLSGYVMPRTEPSTLPALTGQTQQFERCSNSRVRPVVGQALSNQSTCRRVGQACPISSWDRSHRTSRDQSDKSVQPVGSCFSRTVPVRPPVKQLELPCSTG